MVYLKGIFVTSTAIFILAAIMQVDSTKIAYKKSIYGKTNTLTEKRLKLKQEERTTAANILDERSSSSTIVSILNNANEAEAATVSEHIESLATASLLQPETTTESMTDGATDLAIVEDDDVTKRSKVLMDVDMNLEADAETVEKESATLEEEIATRSIIATTSSTTVASNLPVPCTCGIFLNSQFQRGSLAQPVGKPVIVNELDRMFACNAIGQKQCQTKCLETLVQHLPNSANILCATLNRDCRKERAYLFVKNCRNSWWNTNLAAGREYCCKNGQAYPCPLI